MFNDDDDDATAAVGFEDAAIGFDEDDAFSGMRFWMFGGKTGSSGCRTVACRRRVTRRA